MRRDVGGQTRAPVFFREIDRTFAMHIAAADFSNEVVQREMIAGPMNLNRELVGWRQWQRKVGQVVEIGQVLALQFDSGVHAAEIERLGDRATQLYARGAGIDGGLGVVPMVELDI